LLQALSQYSVRCLSRAVVPSGMISWNSSNIGHIISRSSFAVDNVVPLVTNAMMSQASLTSSMNSGIDKMICLLSEQVGLPTIDSCEGRKVIL
jgi:hypothetical protein